MAQNEWLYLRDDEQENWGWRRGETTHGHDRVDYQSRRCLVWENRDRVIGELTDFLPYGSDSPLNQLLLRGIVNKINTLIGALRKMTRGTWSWKFLPETISNRIRK